MQLEKYSYRKLHNDLMQVRKTIKKLESKKAMAEKKIQNYLEKEKAIRDALIFKLNTPTDDTINSILNSKPTQYKNHSELVENLHLELHKEN
ncbi:hypothetical protein BKH43_01855 [Helicobacter sp. 13S00401-1]|uniref:hypothetical protein n=1 Tax=Helicobacter sp. 13S00401-1 TaxID=1905758 RepID=UPI000BA71A80|nr:hypothetical protein [Helicobacter sp. 13S00401-1]PAF51410.1 hypothetical protein BKH43_01855 [Helicobacter sp. 13S00401-1]